MLAGFSLEAIDNEFVLYFIISVRNMLQATQTKNTFWLTPNLLYWKFE